MVSRIVFPLSLLRQTRANWRQTGGKLEANLEANTLGKQEAKQEAKPGQNSPEKTVLFTLLFVGNRSFVFPGTSIRAQKEKWY